MAQLFLSYSKRLSRCPDLQKEKKNGEKLNWICVVAPMNFYRTQAEITAPPCNRKYLPILGERGASYGPRRSKNAMNHRSFHFGISRVFCILVSDNRDGFRKAFITRRSHIRWTNLPWVLGIAGRRTGWSICGSRRGHFQHYFAASQNSVFRFFNQYSLGFFNQIKIRKLDPLLKKPVPRFFK